MSRSKHSVHGQHPLTLTVFQHCQGYVSSGLTVYILRVSVAPMNPSVLVLMLTE